MLGTKEEFIGGADLHHVEVKAVRIATCEDCLRVVHCVFGEQIGIRLRGKGMERGNWQRRKVVERSFNE